MKTIVLYTPQKKTKLPNKQHEFDNLKLCCDNNTKNILQMNTILHPHLRRQICPSGCMCVDLYRVMSQKNISAILSTTYISQAKLYHILWTPPHKIKRKVILATWREPQKAHYIFFPHSSKYSCLSFWFAFIICSLSYMKKNIYIWIYMYIELSTNQQVQKSLQLAVSFAFESYHMRSRYLLM